jgi:ribonuclease HI
MHYCQQQLTPFFAKKQFMINHFFMPKTHVKPPVSNTPFVGYHLAYNKHLLLDDESVYKGTTVPASTAASTTETTRDDMARPTSLSLPASSANPFACFMNADKSVATVAMNSSSSSVDADSYTMSFDGCSKGNPGRAGAGAVIYCNQVEIWADAKFVGARETNNVAEYTGLIMGLHEALRLNISRLTVHGDSEIVIKQMKKEYAVKSPNIKAYYDAAASLARQFVYIHFKHVYREYNVRADELSNIGVALPTSSSSSSSSSSSTLRSKTLQ